MNKQMELLNEKYHKEALVEQLKSQLEPGETMVQRALQYIISHSAKPVAIPGAKSPFQASVNAAAGDKVLTADELAALRY